MKSAFHQFGTPYEIVSDIFGGRKKLRGEINPHTNLLTK